MVVSSEHDLTDLVPSAAQGDRRALQKVIEYIYPAILRYARARISGDRHPTPEDVAQEVCLAVSTSISHFVDRGRPFMAFVYGIASNKVADAHRAMSRDKSTPTEEVPDTRLAGSTPEDLALFRDDSNRMNELLDLLNEKAREIIILRVVVGLSAEETAATVGSSPGAVRVAQHRALAILRQALEKRERTE